ncbi:transporter substrate-binding domain-containing protein [bacterium SCSIO 12741]|nr:transporter substrate-binding domain-containing protein [bacterium SCSIO 12741]
MALVDNSTTSYFLYKGQPMGFEYELLERMCEDLDLELEVKLVYNLDGVLDKLNSGEGDLIAANLTVTRDRNEQANFSEHLFKTRQVLVQNPENSKDLILDPTELAGKTIHVRAGSSFYERLLNLSEEIGEDIDIVALSDSLDDHVLNKTIQLIEGVAKREIQFTVADEHIARVEKKLYPQIHVKTEISLPQKIAWAMRLPDTNLRNAVNDWIIHAKKTNDFHTIKLKYFKARTKLKTKIESDYSSLSGGKISPYDGFILQYGNELNWDWRLLASQIYQESGFDPNAVAWTGASGLMQLLPTTAATYGVDSTFLLDPESNIRAGTRYLAWINDFWKGSVPDTAERTKFVLASYNVGLGHIIDAKNLAAKYGADPTLWDGNVETYILKKTEREYYTDPVCKHGYCRGSEPYNYVREVMARYRHYQNLIE